MINTREQRQTAYKRLPSEVQDLIMSNKTTDLITNTIKEVGLSGKQINLADSEILCSLFCLQNLDDAIKNIAEFSNKNINDLSKLKSTVQDNILSKYKIDIKEFIETNKSESEKISVPEIPLENLPVLEPDFAKDTLATKPGEMAHNVAHVEFDKMDKVNKLNKEEEKPTAQPYFAKTMQDKPVEPLKKEIPIKPDYRYPDGKDPYREPFK